jgi:hypothetical protein
MTAASHQPAATAAPAVMRLSLDNSTRPSSGCRRESRHRCQRTSRTADMVLSLLCTGAPPALTYRPLAPHCARFPSPLVPRCGLLPFPALMSISGDSRWRSSLLIAPNEAREHHDRT